MKSAKNKTLKLTPEQKALILGDPAPKLVTISRTMSIEGWRRYSESLERSAITLTRLGRIVENLKSSVARQEAAKNRLKRKG